MKLIQHSAAKATGKIQIRILNWEKYQNVDGKRYKSTSWFRVENTIWMHELWDRLTDAEFRAMIFLMSFVSQRSHQYGVVETSIPTLARMSGIESEILESTFSKLRDLEVLDTSSVVRSAALESPELVPSDITVHAPCESSDITVHAPCESSDVTVLRTNERNVTERNETNGDPARARACPPPDLSSLWNESSGQLPKVSAISPKRQRLWNSRWENNPDPEYWVAVIKRLAASNFCRGENDRGWRADIDFFLQPDTHLKAVEGKYDNTGGSRRKTHAELVSAQNAEVYAAIERGEA